MFCAGAAAPGLFAQSGTQELKLTVGKSVVIDYPSDVGRISTSNPDVVDAVPITSREILINAKANGQSTLVVWSKTGERSFFAVTVDQNLESIQKLLKETFPNETIEVRATRDSASLNGRVSSPAVGDRAVALIQPMVKMVVNNLTFAPPPIEKQVVLHVKFAELDRNRADQLGLNILSTGATNTQGRITTGQFPSARPDEPERNHPRPDPGDRNPAQSFRRPQHFRFPAGLEPGDRRSRLCRTTTFYKFWPSRTW